MNDWKAKIDLSKISIREFRSLRDGSQSDEEGDELVGRCVGLTAEEVGLLPYDEYRRLMKAFIQKATEPLTDPN